MVIGRIIHRPTKGSTKSECNKDDIECLKALGKDFTSIKIKIEDTLDLVVDKNGVELSCRQLSEGENSIITLAGDIARRLSRANSSNLQPLNGRRS